MDILLVGLVSLFLAAVALAFFMHWLDSWMCNVDLKNDIARPKESMQGQ
jgi:hypothetical protein